MDKEESSKTKTHVRTAQLGNNLCTATHFQCFTRIIHFNKNALKKPEKDEHKVLAKERKEDCKKLCEKVNKFADGRDSKAKENAAKAAAEAAEEAKRGFQDCDVVYKDNEEELKKCEKRNEKYSIEEKKLEEQRKKEDNEYYEKVQEARHKRCTTEGGRIRYELADCKFDDT